MDITILKKIGLSDKEIKVYLKLLEYGAISVRSLAELTELNRGTTYDILKKLQEIGLVSFYHQDTKQKFVAEDPDKLYKVINDQEDELKKAKSKIKEMIPELKSLQEKGGNRPITKLYESKDGIRQILEDLLQTMETEKNKEYYVYSATKASDDINKAFPEFTKQRIKKGINVKAISLAKGGGVYGLDERRWLATNEESATFIIIYAGKCAFISRDSSGNPVGVIIENLAIYETQKIIFLNLWEKLGK
jgi:HTH-type transcriptional regulator, sugar sensing transcriptional regulator